ncbi:MAG: hypothetical protein F6K10_30665 [Moorea sp. SIO2B7]|nr:hypothetical protein [Moorena sp. SIO2B7]
MAYGLTFRAYAIALNELWNNQLYCRHKKLVNSAIYTRETSKPDLDHNWRYSAGLSIIFQISKQNAIAILSTSEVNRIFSRLPIPDSRFPTPDSRFPTPDSLLPLTTAIK